MAAGSTIRSMSCGAGAGADMAAGNIDSGGIIGPIFDGLAGSGEEGKD